MGLSNVPNLQRDATKESAKQGRRDTREARRERRRQIQGLADSEMLAEMGPPQSGTPGLVGDAMSAGQGIMDQGMSAAREAMADAQPMMREGLARMGMPNPAQSMTDAVSAGKEMMDQGMSAGKEMVGQGRDAAAPYVEQGQEMMDQGMSAAREAMADARPMMREGLARVGMPNPAQSMTDAVSAGKEMAGQIPGHGGWSGYNGENTLPLRTLSSRDRRMIDQGMAAGRDITGRIGAGLDAAAPYIEQQGQENRDRWSVDGHEKVDAAKGALPPEVLGALRKMLGARAVRQ